MENMVQTNPNNKALFMIFLFNFNPSESFVEYELPTGEVGDYKIIFNSDEEIFGGQSRIKTDYIYQTKTLQHKENKTGIVIYSPSRTVLVLQNQKNII